MILLEWEFGRSSHQRLARSSLDRPPSLFPRPDHAPLTMEECSAFLIRALYVAREAVIGHGGLIECEDV